MKKLIFIFPLFGLLNACVSTHQLNLEVDSALADVQAGRLEQGRVALEKLCKSGVTGPCALLGQPASSSHPVPILQSVTSEQQSRFVILTPSRGQLSYYVRPLHNNDSDEIAAVRVEPDFVNYGSSSTGLDQIEAFHLNLKTDYELLVLGPKAQLWDRRQFSTLDLAQRRARVAIASCMDDKYKIEQNKIWTQLLQQKPDAILLIGDNVYVDRGASTPSVNPDFIWQRYVETRTALTLFQANPLIPTLAVWDDHDFGKNDGDRTFVYKEQAKDIFFAFFAQRLAAGEFERGPGVASWWNAFGVSFALLDDRSFRSPDSVDLPDQTHFGLEQETWVDQKMREAKRPILTISGDQFFGGYHHFESYQGNHPSSFKQRLEIWKTVRSPLIFVSGDRHLTEIIQVPKEHLGYSTFELTTSGIHAKVFSDAFKRDPSPQQLVGADGKMNYMMVEIMRAARGYLQLDVQSFSLGGKQLFQKTLTVKHE